MFSEIFFPLDIPKIRKSLPITMKLIKPEIQKSRNRFLWYFTFYFFFFRENENRLPHLVPGYFFLCIDQALPQSKWAMVHTKKSQLTSQPHCQRPCKDEISNYIHLLYFCTPNDSGIMTDAFLQLWLTFQFSSEVHNCHNLKAYISFSL